MDKNGNLVLKNVGRRPVYVHGKPFLTGQSTKLEHRQVIEVKCVCVCVCIVHTEVKSGPCCVGRRILLGADFVLTSPFSPSHMSTLMQVDMLHFVNSVHQSEQDISTDYFRYLAFTTSALLDTCFSRVFNSIHCLNT